METPIAVLMVELVMSADRLVTTASGSSPQPGQWTPQVVLGHVATNDRKNWMPRVTAMVQAHRDAAAPVTFDWYEPAPEVFEDAFGDMSIDEAGAALLSSRTALVTMLRELGTDDWQARAVHSVFGELDVRGLLFQVLAHDEQHRGDLLGVTSEGTLDT